MKKRIPILLVALAAVGCRGVVCGIARYGQGARQPAGDFRKYRADEVNIAFKTAGRLIERAVDEGDVVKKGQVVARLDRDQLLAQRDREAAGLAVERIATGAGADDGGVAAREPGGRHRDAARGPGSRRKRGWRSCATERGRRRSWTPRRRWTRRRAKLERAQKDWDRAQTLYKNDDISTAQFDQYRNRSKARRRC